MSIIDDVIGAVKGGSGSLLDTVLGMTDLDDKLMAKVAELGVTPEILADLKAKYAEMSADGTVTKEEIMQAVKELAAEKGLPVDALTKLTDMLPATDTAAEEVASVAEEATN